MSHTHHARQDTAGRNIWTLHHLLAPPPQRMAPLLTPWHMTLVPVLRSRSPAWSHWVCLEGTSPTSPSWHREGGERGGHGFMSFTLGYTQQLCQTCAHTRIHAWLIPEKAELQCQSVYIFTHFSLLIFLFFKLWHIWQGEDLCSSTQSYNFHFVSQTENKAQITVSFSTVRFAIL